MFKNIMIKFIFAIVIKLDCLFLMLNICKERKNIEKICFLVSTFKSYYKLNKKADTSESPFNNTFERLGTWGLIFQSVSKCSKAF